MKTNTSTNTIIEMESMMITIMTIDGEEGDFSVTYFTFKRCSLKLLD